MGVLDRYGFFMCGFMLYLLNWFADVRETLYENCVTGVHANTVRFNLLKPCGNFTYHQV
jgi:hypothetical protein